VKRLGPAPDDPGHGARWRREVSIIAAYRDRWQISDPAPIGTATKIGSTEQMSQFRRALAAAERARVISQLAGTKQADVNHDVSIDVGLRVEL
jgi:hypothetical protein